MQNLKIDGERLWGELMETARIGGTPKGGICRLTLSDLDRQGRDWVKARADRGRELDQRGGCAVLAGHDLLGRVRGRIRPRLGSLAPGPIGHHLRRSARGDRLPRPGTMRRTSALGVVRAAYRAGPDSRSG